MLPCIQKNNEYQAFIVRDSHGLKNHWAQDIIGFAAENMNYLEHVNAAGADIYYTPCAYSPKEGALTPWKGRTSKNVSTARAIWLDIDAKDQADPTIEGCILALHAFVLASKLPPPTTIINSGGGLHVYWVFVEDVPLDTWLKLSQALVNATRGHKLLCDTQCTVDRARILRVPGFINHKRGVRVETLLTTQRYFITDIEAPLSKYEQPLSTGKGAMGAIKEVNQFTEYAHVKTNILVSEDSNISSWAKIKEATKRGDGCGVLAWVMENQAKVKYALWTGVLSIAKHTDAPEIMVQETCSEHPEYDRDASLDKMASFSGPRTCVQLCADAAESGMPNPCEGCPYKGKVGSPVVLGTQAFVLRNSTEVVMTHTVQHTEQGITIAPTAVVKPALPWPYTRKAGVPGVFQLVKGEDGTWTPEEHPLIDADLDVLGVQESSAGVTAVFSYTHPIQGARTFSIPIASLAVPRGELWPAILADNYINMTNAAVNPQWRANVNKYLNTIIQQSVNKEKSTRVVEQFGPLKGAENTTFVYGTVCYHKDKPPEQVVLSEKLLEKYGGAMLDPPKTQEQVNVFRQKIRVWCEGLQETIGGVEFGPDQFILATGFACPLAPFIVPARNRGGIIIPNSTEAGSGKTSMVARITQMYASGDEKLLIPDTTLMAFLEQNVALAGALPVVWDELMKARDDNSSSQLHQLALSATNRKPRQRLTGVRTDISWHSWFYGTTNPDPHEALAVVNNSAHGAAARILSVKVSPKRFGTGADLLRKQRKEQFFSDWCKENANVVGQTWIAHFMQNLDRLSSKYDAWAERLLTDAPAIFQDPAMRFNVSIVTCTMVAAEEAKAIGLHPFTVDSIYAYALTLLGSTVTRAEDAREEEAHALASLLNTSLGVTVFIDKSQPLNNMIPKSEVGVRIEKSPDGVCTVEIARAYARKWCSQRRIALSILLTNLNEVGYRNDSTRLTRDTTIVSMKTAVYAFTMPTANLGTTAKELQNLLDKQ